MDADAPRRYGLIGAESAAVVLVGLGVLAAPARADGPSPRAMKPQEVDLWQRDKLSGDWGGARTELSKRGIDITFNYMGETLGMLGGFRQGVSYEHRFELSIDTDLEKFLGWSGASAHTTFYQIGHAHGTPAADYVGSIADPSNIEAVPATPLFTAWFQKNFLEAKASVPLGHIPAATEILLTPTAAN